MPVRRLLTCLLIFSLVITQTAQAYSLAWLPHQPIPSNTNQRQAVVSLNNKGDLGKTLNDLGQSQHVKALVTAMVTAGMLQGLNATAGIQKVNAQSTFPEQLQKNLLNNTASAVVNHAINGGDLQQQLEQSIRSAFIDTGSAQGANGIGDLYQNGTLNDFTHQLAHAIAGCAAGAAKSNDCSSGAFGAVVGEMSAELYGGARLNSSNLDIPALQTDTANFARMMSGIAVAITGGDANAINLAANAGGNAAQNNFLNHQRPSMLAFSEAERYAAAQEGCAQGDASACQVKANLEQLSLSRDNQIAQACNSGANGECRSGIQAAVSNGSSLGWASNGNLYVISPEYSSLTSGNPQTYPSRAGVNAILNDQQQWASVGTPALMLVPGPIGLLTSSAVVASGSYQFGQGIGAVNDGQYGAGVLDMGLGSMAIFGGSAGALGAVGGFKPVGGDIAIVSDTQSVFHVTPTAGQAQSILNGIDPVYLNPNSRFGAAFYVAEEPGTALAELAHYGIDPTTGIRFNLNTNAMKVLDLTNPETAAAYGYQGGPISSITQSIGEQAQALGYNVIRYPSERANGGVNNAILNNYNDILKPVIVTPVKP